MSYVNGIQANNAASVSGLDDVSCSNVYADGDVYCNNIYSTTTTTLQASIDSINAQLNSIALGYYGVFLSTISQANPTANTPNYATINTMDASNNGVVWYNSDGAGNYREIQVLHKGVYNIEFSLQLTHSNSSQDTIEIWFRKNGTDIANSNSSLTIKDNAQDAVPAWNLVVELEANDRIALMWASSMTAVSLKARAAQTSPFVSPGIPSVILTVQQVMNTMQGPQGAVGPSGPAGPVGPKGDQGIQGPRGPKGDTDVTSWILGLSGVIISSISLTWNVLLTLGLFASVGEDGLQGGTIGSLQSQVAYLENAVAALQAKTQYQGATPGAGITTFYGQLNVSGGLSAAVTMDGGSGEVVGRRFLAKSLLGDEKSRIDENGNVISYNGQIKVYDSLGVQRSTMSATGVDVQGEINAPTLNATTVVNAPTGNINNLNVHNVHNDTVIDVSAPTTNIVGNTFSVNNGIGNCTINLGTVSGISNTNTINIGNNIFDTVNIMGMPYNPFSTVNVYFNQW